MRRDTLEKYVDVQLLAQQAHMHVDIVLYLSQGFAGRRPIGHAIFLTLQLVYYYFSLINVYIII